MRQDQLIFNLPRRVSFRREDFFISSSNRGTLSILDNWRDWPSRKLGLIGPRSSGKSHLVSLWAERTDAEVVSVSDLKEENIRGLIKKKAVAIEDINDLEKIQGKKKFQTERALLHLYNTASENDCYFLISGTEAPANWAISLKDLSSRLKTLTLTFLLPPDDELLKALIVKQFEDRQIMVAPELITYVAKRIERSFKAIKEFADLIDKKSLSEKREITIPVAKAILDGLAINWNGFSKESYY